MHITILQSFILGFISGAIAIALRILYQMRQMNRAADEAFRRYWTEKSNR